MNQVITFTEQSNVDKPLIQKLFKKFQLVYGNIWKSQFDGLDLNEAMDYWLGEFKEFSQEIFVNAVKHSCDQYRDYPPKIGQLIDLCWKYEGVPTVREVIQLVIRQEFNHPVVLEVYEKIGSWAFKNSKENDLLTLVTPVYQECLHNFKNDLNTGWAKLSVYTEKKLLESQIPPKIPNSQECKSFRERLAEYQKMANEVKVRLEPDAHPSWDKEKITHGHVNFDEKYYYERRSYLIGLDEILAGTLNRVDWFDRNHYLMEVEAQEIIRNNPNRNFSTKNNKIVKETRRWDDS